MKQLFPRANTPRWIIFLIDLTLCVFGLFIAYLVRFEFAVPKEEWDLAVKFIPVYIAIRGIAFFFGKTYSGIIRYTGSQDAIRIFVVLSLGSLLFFALNVVAHGLFKSIFLVPTSVIIIDYLLSLFALIIFRLAVKMIYAEVTKERKEKKRIVVFGAGEGALILKRTLDKDASAEYEVMAFFDDDTRKAGKQLEGIRIYPTADLEDWLNHHDVEDLFISLPDIGVERKRELADLAVRHKLKLKHVPHARNWINGSLSANQIRTVQYEDLLGREEIHIESPRVRNFVQGKRVLITGAAGSIGSEIVRQILMFNPEGVLALDAAETPMFQLGRLNEMAVESGKLELVIGDIRNETRMVRVFEHFKPEVVFHAAAYKHVPLMEENPAEAVFTNVFGTKLVIELSQRFNVSNFVLISTDKAVNPTNIMGASKRIAELIVQSKAGALRSVVTRFGNVLGSNGSVIPVFRKQIEQGGPVTVTHPDIERFFMTIPEAVQLVLEAASGDGDNEIVVFDMGKQIKIAELARKMILLSGLEPNVDIQIEYTGLRPGEKLYEEVLASEENLKATHHPKILKANPRTINESELNEKLILLHQAALAQDNMLLVSIMKELVPEFKSNNSTYSQLD